MSGFEDQVRDIWGQMTSSDALRHLIDVVELTGRHEHDAQTAAALKWIHDILDQRGCEDFDPAGDGSLTDLIDIVVRG